MDYQDILYKEESGVATITINRPEVYNAFRGITVEEMIQAFSRASWHSSCGVIVLTGAGAKVISENKSTHHAGRIRMSHLGKSGLRSNRASISRIAFLDSEMPFR